MPRLGRIRHVSTLHLHKPSALTITQSIARASVPEVRRAAASSPDGDLCCPFDALVPGNRPTDAQNVMASPSSELPSGLAVSD